MFTIISCLALFQWGTIVPQAYAVSPRDVTIQNFAFSPQSATILTGDSVTWANNDPVVYTLWFTNSGDGSTYLLSPPINPGTTWTHVFPGNVSLTYYDFDRLYISGQLITGAGGGSSGRVMRS